ncbi:MAG: heavy-metal-associated domain-containing protein [Eubacterium sp.]
MKKKVAISKIPGVTKASISFMTQKLVIEAEEERFDAIMQEAVKVCKKVEPDCAIQL